MLQPRRRQPIKKTRRTTPLILNVAKNISQQLILQTLMTKPKEDLLLNNKPKAQTIMSTNASTRTSRAKMMIVYTNYSRANYRFLKSFQSSSIDFARISHKTLISLFNMNTISCLNKDVIKTSKQVSWR